MSERYHIIIADHIDATQRTLIQAFVERNAEDWWHQFLDAWIVRGETAKFWRDQLRVMVPYSPSALLVLTLPEDRRPWAGKMPGTAMEWFRETYSTKPEPSSQIPEQS